MTVLLRPAGIAAFWKELHMGALAHHMKHCGRLTLPSVFILVSPLFSNCKFYIRVQVLAWKQSLMCLLLPDSWFLCAHSPHSLTRWNLHLAGAQRNESRRLAHRHTWWKFKVFVKKKNKKIFCDHSLTEVAVLKQKKLIDFHIPIGTTPFPLVFMLTFSIS